MRTRGSPAALACLGVVLLLAIPPTAAVSAASGPAGARAPSPVPSTKVVAPAWNEVCPNLCAVSGAASAYDPAIGGLVLFGGRYDAGNGLLLLNDTWTYARGGWTKLAPARSPSPRYGAELAYDTAAGFLLLFGGTSWCPGSTTSLCALNDSWEFNGSTWTNLSLRGPRAEASAMAYDARAKKVVLLQGSAPGLKSIASTWVFQAGLWIATRVASPPVALDASLAYDALDGELVLFGGRASLTAPPSAATWTYANGRWSNLSRNASASPPARLDAIESGLGPNGGLDLYGGDGAKANGASAPLFDLWHFAGGNWTPVTGTGTPPTAYSASAVGYLPASGCLVLVGGVTKSSDYSAKAWSLCAGTWGNVTFPANPPGRAGVAMAYDPLTGSVLFFGGDSGAYFYSGTWSYRAGQWTLLAPSASPSARADAMLVYDPILRAMLLFGGANASGPLNDTWEYAAGNWTRLATPVAPPAREAAAMAYDAFDLEVVLFGGTDSRGVLGDTWAYRSGGWVNLTGSLSRSPAAREGAAVTYDPSVGGVVLFGGSGANASRPYDDTWRFHAGHWSPVAAAGRSAPDGALFASMVYEPSLGIVLMGGLNASLSTNFSTSQDYVNPDAVLTTSGWVYPSSGAGPVGFHRDRFGMAYDSVTRTLVVYGGYWGSVDYSDTWVD